MSSKPPGPKTVLAILALFMLPVAIAGTVVTVMMTNDFEQEVEQIEDAKDDTAEDEDDDVAAE